MIEMYYLPVVPVLAFASAISPKSLDYLWAFCIKCSLTILIPTEDDKGNNEDCVDVGDDRWRMWR